MQTRSIPSFISRDATIRKMRFLRRVLIALFLAASPALPSTAQAIRGAAPVVPLSNEPPPKIVVDPPLAGPLSFGRVVIQYRTENLHIVPVFGPAALTVSPRIGHIHVTVDDLPWHWADASGEPLILNGFPPGKHKVLIELVSPNHQTIDKGVVTFIVPKVTHDH